MLTELELFYAGVLLINGIGIAAAVVYQWKRLKIEAARSAALERQRDDLRAYYDNRLSIEKAKLEVERAKLETRRNGP